MRDSYSNTSAIFYSMLGEAYPVQNHDILW